MNQPQVDDVYDLLEDLIAMANHVSVIRELLSRLDDEVEVAYLAALGVDEQGQNVPPSGDDERTLEDLKHRVAGARIALTDVRKAIERACGARALRGRTRDR